jgi:hypothetical protein
MSACLRAIAFALGGDISGRSTVIAPGPGHSRKDRSLSVKLSASSPDGFICFSHAGDDWRQCRDYVRGKLGLAAFQPYERRTPPRHRDRAKAAPPDNAKTALRLWRQAVDPRGTLVEAYLKGRGLDLPGEAAFEAIRFHGDCPFGGERFPAMVCLIRNIVTNAPQGVHRTALAQDGTAIKRNDKTFRMTLGPVVGGAIKLDPDEDVTHGLCIGEGVETTLAGRQMGLRPGWAGVNTAGVASFPILPGIDGLHIFRESDLNGASARDAESCARRWYEAGRDVFIVDPDIGKDLNDELREAAR